jgi:arylsulfatase A-like enzyme
MPVNAVDITPTLLALAGAEVPRVMQGDNLSAWLSGAGGERSESVYVQGRLGADDEWRMVVRGLDKIVVDRDLQTTHLYNLGQDPYEMENLATENGQRRRRDEMQAILLDSMRRASDKILPSGLRLRD